MKKTLNLLILLPALLSFSSCGAVTPEDVPDTPVIEEDLEETKQTYKNALDGYVTLNDYREAEQEQIRQYIASAKAEIDAATTKAEISEIVQRYLTMINALKTDEDYRKEEIPTYDNCLSTEQIRQYAKEGYVPIYEDPTWRYPFTISNTKQVPDEPVYYENPLFLYEGKETQPKWEIAQWGSKYNIYGENEETDGYTLAHDETGLVHTIESKGKIINNHFVPAKKLIFNTIEGSVYLELNGSVEYDHPRTSSEAWAHLLVQDSSYPIDDMYRISAHESIIAEAEITIDKFIDHMGSEANAGLHAAQIVWYLKIRNRNADSPGRGESIWFGLPIWDNRQVGKTYAAGSQYDVGTHTLITSPSSYDVYTSNRGIVPSVGQTAKITADVSELLKEAFMTAKTEGYLTNSMWNDLYIDHTNFGYEMPGTYDLGMTIHSINVFVK